MVFMDLRGLEKSLLLRCVNQLTIPDPRKSMAHNGEEVVHSQGKYNSYRQKMGMVFQNFYLFDHLTALGNVEIFLAES